MAWPKSHGKIAFYSPEHTSLLHIHLTHTKSHKVQNSIDNLRIRSSLCFLGTKLIRFPEGRRMASMAPWRELLQNAMQSHKHLKHSTHLQLATVRPDGRPANRTIVFRGFVDGTNNMQFTTDARSQKIDEIKHCAFGEICYYFTDSWEQFRIHGILDVISNRDSDPSRKSLREKAWFDSSPRSREGFGAPHPGHPKTTGSETPKLDPSQGPLDTFCVLLLKPEEIDYYHAKEMQRIMFRSSSENGQIVWSQQELNP